MFTQDMGYFKGLECDRHLDKQELPFEELFDDLKKVDELETELHEAVCSVEDDLEELHHRFARLAQLEPDPDGQSWFECLEKSVAAALALIQDVDSEMLNHDPR